ncbi:hypothetical protein ARMSODRAFT_978240 [Armillaria solidipes]|uniref:Uncharacterized protein n=1 Tax=Armillaria solidipes TaxID=1076256 RepID=A0A2H3B6W7_9AGAR|nr:hypothetical protein ARMSODRAFT_978240 [Armillaria solidipes]
MLTDLRVHGTSSWMGSCPDMLLPRRVATFPFALAENEEPTAEALMLVNDNASSNIPKIPFPDVTKLTPQVFVKAMMAYMTYNEKVKDCEDRIDRWLHYHHNKSLKPMIKDDPYRHVLAKLAGVQASKPCRRTAYNLWCELYGNEVEEELVKLVQEGKVTSKQKLGKRQTMWSDRYTSLSKEEQCEWTKRSKEEHDVAMAEWKIVAKHTKGKVFMLWGGPEPGDGSHLNLMSLCAGKTSGPGLSDIVKTGPEDCQAMALPNVARDEALGLGMKEYEDAFVHCLKEPKHIGSASSSASPPIDTSTCPPQPKKSASKSSRLPTLSELLASKVATVDKLRLPELSPPLSTSPTEPQLGAGITQFPSGRMVLSGDSHDALPLKSRQPLPVLSLCLSPPISCAPSPAPSPLASASAASYSTPPHMPSASPPPLPPSPPASAPHPCPDLTQASAPPNLGATNPLAPSSKISLAHSFKKLYPSISTGTVTVSLPSRTCKSMQHESVDHPADPVKQRGIPIDQLTISKCPADGLPSDSTLPKQRKTVGGNGGPGILTVPAGSKVSAPQLPDSIFPHRTPLWAVQALDTFRSKDFGLEWTSIVNSWVAFQVASDFESKDKLLPRFRPESQTWRPPYEGIDLTRKFQDLFWVWWAHLQPERRVEDLEDGFTDLGHNTRSGINGFLSIIAALFFWCEGVSIAPRTTHRERTAFRERRKELNFTMGDVDYVLKGILA